MNISQWVHCGWGRFLLSRITTMSFKFRCIKWIQILFHIVACPCRPSTVHVAVWSAFVNEMQYIMGATAGAPLRNLFCWWHSESTNKWPFILPPGLPRILGTRCAAPGGSGMMIHILSSYVCRRRPSSVQWCDRGGTQPLPPYTRLSIGLST